MAASVLRYTDNNVPRQVMSARFHVNLRATAPYRSFRPRFLRHP